MFEFVCVMYFTHEHNEHLYIGHFTSCEKAYEFVGQNYKTTEYKWIKCLHHDYIYLPKNLEIREVK